MNLRGESGVTENYQHAVTMVAHRDSILTGVMVKIVTIETKIQERQDILIH
jgi:hypothetical protein